MVNNSIKFDLINNAKDSLNHVVEHLTNAEGASPGDLKRAIKDVAHAIELLLKERLRRVHPAFIWQDVDKYPSDRAYIVSTIKAVERLSKVAKVSLSDGEKKTIYACKKVRDAIEHYEFVFDLQETKGIIGRMLSLILDFSKRHLDLDLEQEFRKDDRWEALIEIYEFWEAHDKAVEKQLSEEGKPVWECISCGASTFDLSIMKCVLCGHAEELIECDVCHEEHWESEITKVEGIDGDPETGGEYYDINICEKCLNKERMMDMQTDFLRDMGTP